MALRKPRSQTALHRAKKAIDLIAPRKLNTEIVRGITTSKQHRKGIAKTVKSFRKEGNRAAAKKTLLIHGATASRFLKKALKISHFGQLWNGKR